MSSQAGEFVVWEPPDTFRERAADAERVAATLVEQLANRVDIPVSEIEFLARRVHWLARAVHRSLPPEVV